MAIYPSLRVEIGFADNPTTFFDTATATDVSSYVRSVTINRGRSHELDRMQAGVATIVLDNRDQRFDPVNTAGPYYPNVKPMRWVSIAAVWGATVYRQFVGHIESWPQQWSSPNDAFVTVEAIDSFKMLNMIDVTHSYTAELSGTRVGNILDHVNWPALGRNIDAGQTTIQASTYEAANALSALQDVASAENGAFFCARDGKATFHSRHTRVEKTIDTANDTWGDGTGDKPYTDAIATYDDSLLWNDITVTKEGTSTSATKQDATSIATYYRRSLVVTVPINSTSELADHASWLRARFKEPQIRFRTLVVQGARSPSDLWPRILTYDLGDRIVVERNPPGAGTELLQYSTIEGISHSISPIAADRNSGGPWVTTWQLSGIGQATGGNWLASDPVLSQAGITTSGAY